MSLHYILSWLITYTLFIFILACPEDFSNGILWETTVAGTLVTVPCTQAGNQFRSGLVASRQCYSVARWGPVDFTNCLLKQDAGNSATIWVTLDVNSIEEIRNNQTSLENSVSYFNKIIIIIIGFIYTCI